MAESLQSHTWLATSLDFTSGIVQCLACITRMVIQQGQFLVQKMVCFNSPNDTGKGTQSVTYTQRIIFIVCVAWLWFQIEILPTMQRLLQLALTLVSPLSGISKALLLFCQNNLMTKNSLFHRAFDFLRLKAVVQASRVILPKYIACSLFEAYCEALFFIAGQRLHANIPQRQAEAVDLIKQSADYGHTDSQLLYAWCCYRGIGRAKNTKEASHYEQLAKKNPSSSRVISPSKLTDDKLPIPTASFNDWLGGSYTPEHRCYCT